MKNAFLFVLFPFSLISTAFADAPTSFEIPNFVQVNSAIYRGGRPTAAGLQKLAQMGIKTIINLQGGDLQSDLSRIIPYLEPGELPSAIKAEGEMAHVLRMNYLSYPLNSMEEVTELEAESIASILADFKNPALQPVFIHCEHGKDRTGLLIALERTQAEGWTKQRAWNEWVKLGHGRMAQFFTHALDQFFDSIN